tara:strand:- start:74987 stop:75997 length:1011 start_codon:yes stop_codon:yes gene_type:complete
MIYLDLLNFKSSLIFFLILIINLTILNYRVKIAKFLNILDLPNSRKVHNMPTPLVGGICLFLTISVSTILIFSNSLIPLNKLIIYLLLYLIFFTIGLWDDAKNLSPKIRTFIILISIIILTQFENDFLLNKLIFKTASRDLGLGNFSFIFTIFCIFALYNALNFIDGFNGSATSIIIFWTFFLLIKNPNLLYLFTIINMIIIFLYNLSGKIFLGNSGTSVLSIFFSLSIINDYNTTNALYADEILFILLFPGIDMIRVTFERIINKKKIYYADKTHFHHYLIKKKIKYVWQIIFILTIIPLGLFYLSENMVLAVLVFIFVYFTLLSKLRKEINATS